MRYIGRIRLDAVCLALVVMSPALLTSAAQAQDQLTAEQLADEHVLKAIDAIVEELYARKDPQRFWDPIKPPAGESTTQGGGYTALTVLSLLYAGQSYQDPRLRDAIEYLADYPMGGTYAVSLRAAVWAKLPAKFRKNLEADIAWLLAGFSQKSSGWTYEQKPNSTRRDNSITQFAALALWEAAKRGARIDPRLWQALEERFLVMQLPDGGWNYIGQGPATGSMTAAGLATLFITQDYVHAEDSLDLESPRDRRHEQAIARGLEWMNGWFSPVENPGRFSDFYYYLYGVERVGLASGRKYFGPHDWFREGAAELIGRLCRWDEAERIMTVHERIGGRGNAGRVRVRHLTFALMFLSRGRAPVAFNKLQAEGMPWNNRPRDVANLTAWISDHSEADLAWQIVDMSGEPEEWLDASVLYLASDRAPAWMKDLDADAKVFIRDARRFLKQRAAGEIPMDAEPPLRPEVAELVKLKRYLDLGGLIFAVNEGSSRAFAESIERAGQVMYPQYEWRALPRGHWAYALNFPVRARRPALRGLSNGVRELIILAPAGDLARTYQGREETKASHFQTAANIYFHASELNRPRPRLAGPAADVPTDAGQEGVITIVRALHEGNWKPEPLALPALAARLAREQDLQLRIIDWPLSMIDRLGEAPSLVLVNGIEKHRFSEAQKEAIRRFVERAGAPAGVAIENEDAEPLPAKTPRGGPILFETPGGRGEFTQSAEEMISGLLNRPVTPLIRHPIITGEGIDGAATLTRLEYRPYSTQVFGDGEIMPRLTGVEIGGELRILFSREDLSHALLDRTTWGISGYTPDAAVGLMGNIVRYAVSSTGGSDSEQD
ncbi:MAG: hypothetical protein JSV91_07230 [Phycisphaerales bacterium]|nr:MAG: hypothetical protein JSV91_07230 [Phycisphaerales bacterium]